MTTPDQTQNGTPGIHLIGLYLIGIGVTQLLIATAWWRTGGRAIAPLASLLILAGEVLQVATGHSHQLAVHIPLDIALVAGTVAFAVWISRQRAAFATI